MNFASHHFPPGWDFWAELDDDGAKTGKEVMDTSFVHLKETVYFKARLCIDYPRFGNKWRPSEQKHMTSEKNKCQEQPKKLNFFFSMENLRNHRLRLPLNPQLISQKL